MSHTHPLQSYTIDYYWKKPMMKKREWRKRDECWLIGMRER
jgi:hypothetical protein